MSERLPVEDYIEDWQREAVEADRAGDKDRARFCLEVVVFNRRVLARLQQRAKEREYRLLPLERDQ